MSVLFDSVVIVTVYKGKKIMLKDISWEEKWRQKGIEKQTTSDIGGCVKSRLTSHMKHDFVGIPNHVSFI